MRLPCAPGTEERKSQRARRAQRAGDAGEITEDTEDTQGDTEIWKSQRAQRVPAAKETADFADLVQIESVLAYAGLPGFRKSQRAQRSQRTKSAPAGRRAGRRPSPSSSLPNPSPSPLGGRWHAADVPRVFAARAITKAQRTTKGTKSFGVPVRHVADVPRVQGELPPAGVQGAAPLALSSPFPFPFSPASCKPLCSLCPL